MDFHYYTSNNMWAQVGNVINNNPIKKPQPY
jgi:hypothetical protein